ncbi:hypothetical protein [Flavobacterium sp.]|uniref:hypothetical protein n=1 Tax=Flavobacterium sp. TaxID=239 RepID=UPI00286D9A8E|nr:hypothetical protein [Flavobacterium sp.]
MKFKFNNLISPLLKILIIISFLIFCYYFSLKVEGTGDEHLFLNDLKFLKLNNWFEAISKKMAIAYLILAYPISFIIKDYLALRLVNVLLFLLLLLYCRKIGEIKNKMFYFYFLFYSSNGWFLLGTNDTLFIVSLFIFFNEVYKFLENKKNTSIPLLWCSLIVAFFTRELVYVYIPVIIISFVLLINAKVNLLNKIAIPIGLLGLFFLINSPSIITNHSFSYDNKKPPVGVKSNWAQRQYLAQLMVNDGKLNDEQHPSWQETDDYLLKNGKNSLPSTISEGVLFDFKLTVKEFFKDFSKVILQSIRQTGLIVIILIMFLMYNVLKNKIETNLYIPFILFLMIAIFSFIIISFVEIRWLTPLFIIALVYYSDLESNKKINKNIFLLNNLMTILVLFYGLYRVMHKL